MSYLPTYRISFPPSQPPTQLHDHLRSDCFLSVLKVAPKDAVARPVDVRFGEREDEIWRSLCSNPPLSPRPLAGASLALCCCSLFLAIVVVVASLAIVVVVVVALCALALFASAGCCSVFLFAPLCDLFCSSCIALLTRLAA